MKAEVIQIGFLYFVAVGKELIYHGTEDYDEAYCVARAYNKKHFNI